MREKTDTLPKATAKRLPLYLRYLKMLDDSGISRIKSNEFSEITQIPSATIRRDFSQLGELGRSGYGYDVPFLIDVFNNILNTKEEKRIALVGYGNLGKALKHNNFRRNENLNIVCVFEIAKAKNVTVAISTVPSKYSQSAIDEIVKGNVTAILNFAPDRVTVPAYVNVQYIDLTTELQTLIYFDENYSEVFS